MRAFSFFVVNAYVSASLFNTMKRLLGVAFRERLLWFGKKLEKETLRRIYAAHMDPCVWAVEVTAE